MLRILVLGLIVGLVVVRLLRRPWARRLLRIPLRVLDTVYVVALLLAGTIAVITEEWVLLGVLGVLLVWAGVELVRERAARREEGAPGPREVRRPGP